MNTTQIICLIGIIIVTYLLGRASKRIKFPIAGEIDFTDYEKEQHPLMIFRVSFDEMKKHHYIVFRIRGGINPNNERRDV